MIGRYILGYLMVYLNVFTFLSDVKLRYHVIESSLTLSFTNQVEINDDGHLYVRTRDRVQC